MSLTARRIADIPPMTMDLQCSSFFREKFSGKRIPKLRVFGAGGPRSTIPGNRYFGGGSSSFIDTEGVVEVEIDEGRDSMNKVLRLWWSVVVVAVSNI